MARTISMIAGGKESELYKATVPELREAEDRVIKRTRDSSSRLDVVAKEMGYRDLTHLRQAAGTDAGQSRTDYVDFTIGGEVHEIPVGQAIHLLSMDPMTLERMDKSNEDGEFKGAKLRFVSGDSTTDYEFAKQDILRFRNEMAQSEFGRGLINFAAAMKAEFELVRQDVFDAVREITGKSQM